MSTSAGSAVIPHHRKCSRPVPVLRTNWAGEPVAWCPGCGREGSTVDRRAER